MGNGVLLRLTEETKQKMFNLNQEAVLLKTVANNININKPVEKQFENLYCDETLFKNLPEENKIFCSRKSKLTDATGIEVDLTNNKAFLYENKKLVKILPLLYQAPEDKWFQSPTGYYKIGVKKENHISSIFPVKMPYAIQYYEDFFLHGIPLYENGTQVSSNFTGGCLRFEDAIAKEIYEFLKTGYQIAVYKTFDDLALKPEFALPVNLENFWIRQRFNNPYRAFWTNSGSENLKYDYYLHTGVDFAPEIGTTDTAVRAIYDGEISKIQPNDNKDHGLGNTVILKHNIGEKIIYSLYAHLDSVKENLKEGDLIKKGETFATVGNSANGCRNYWRIGFEGCKQTSPNDTHLHFEIKTAPTLENPIGGDACKRQNGSLRPCFGYTPDYPEYFGYLNPIKFLFDKKTELE